MRISVILPAQFSPRRPWIDTTATNERPAFRFACTRPIHSSMPGSPPAGLPFAKRHRGGPTCSNPRRLQPIPDRTANSHSGTAIVEIRTRINKAQASWNPVFSRPEFLPEAPGNCSRHACCAHSPEAFRSRICLRFPLFSTFWPGNPALRGPPQWCRSPLSACWRGERRL